MTTTNTRPPYTDIVKGSNGQWIMTAHCYRTNSGISERYTTRKRAQIAADEFVRQHAS